jgi:hypothetical protein
MGGGERTWDRWRRFLVGGLLMVTLTGSPATAEMQLLPGAAADLDQATVDEVLATFRQAEQALRAGDVDGIMALYSEQYNYHGLKKTDMRKVWINLFDEFRELSDTPSFFPDDQGRIRLQDHHRGHLYGQFVGPVENRRVTCADRQLV